MLSTIEAVNSVVNNFIWGVPPVLGNTATIFTHKKGLLSQSSFA